MLQAVAGPVLSDGQRRLEITKLTVHSFVNTKQVVMVRGAMMLKSAEKHYKIKSEDLHLFMASMTTQERERKEERMCQ